MSPSTTRLARPSRPFARRHRRAVLALAALLAGLPARAQTGYWNTGYGDWSVWTNWDNLNFFQIPDDLTDAHVFGGQAYLQFAYGEANQLFIGDFGSSGQLDLLASSFFARSTTYIGNNGGAGQLTLQGNSSWTGSGNLIVGETASGLLNIIGGQVTNQQAFIGGQSSHTGTVNVVNGGRWLN